MNERNAIKEKLDLLVTQIKTRHKMVVKPAIPANQKEEKILTAIREYWVENGFYTIEEIDNTFKIPLQFSVFLENYADFRQKKGSWSLMDWQGIITDTAQYWYKYFLNQKDEYKANDKYPPMLLYIGGWSDKHWYFMCCEKGDHFGKVFECYDTDFFDLPHIYEAQWSDFFTMLECELQ